MWSRSGRIWPIPGRRSPNSAESAPASIETGPTLVQGLRGTGRELPASVEDWPPLVDSGPKSAEICRALSDSGRVPPRSPNYDSKVCRVRPVLDRLRPRLAKLRPQSCKFEPLHGKIDPGSLIGQSSASRHLEEDTQNASRDSKRASIRAAQDSIRWMHKPPGSTRPCPPRATLGSPGASAS